MWARDPYGTCASSQPLVGAPSSVPAHDAGTATYLTFLCFKMKPTSQVTPDMVTVSPGWIGRACAAAGAAPHTTTEAATAARVVAPRRRPIRSASMRDL